MKRLPQLSRPNTTNVPGLDLVRLIDVRDIQGVVSPNEVYAVSETLLPAGWIVPNPDAVWVDFFFTAGEANYVPTVVPSVHGPSVKHTLQLPIGNDSPEYAKVVKLLSKGRWMAFVMDANEQVKLVGLPEQPLKLKQASQSRNAWVVELVTETLYPAYHVSEWDLEKIYGNPADYSFDFSLDFNA